MKSYLGPQKIKGRVIPAEAGGGPGLTSMASFLIWENPEKQ